VSRPAGPKPAPKVWIRWIRKVAGRRRSISAKEYDKKRPEGAPSSRTIARWAGKPWSAVCAEAGKQAANPVVRRWSDETKLASVRAASRDLDPGEYLTLRRYQNWRAEQPDPAAYPSILAFGDAGSWLEWCGRAGVDGGKKRRRHECPDREMLEHLIAAGDGSGRVGTTRYELYRDQHLDAPSRATIIGRFRGPDGRGWHRAEAAAAALVAERLGRAVEGGASGDRFSAGLGGGDAGSAESAEPAASPTGPAPKSRRPRRATVATSA
jgi:hypothetical protein